MHKCKDAEYTKLLFQQLACGWTKSTLGWHYLSTFAHKKVSLERLSRWHKIPYQHTLHTTHFSVVMSQGCGPAIWECGLNPNFKNHRNSWVQQRLLHHHSSSFGAMKCPDSDKMRTPRQLDPFLVLDHHDSLDLHFEVRWRFTFRFFGFPKGAA